MDPRPVVEAAGLTRRYGSFVAVDHVSFRVGAGRTVGLIGPNGAGKSTILHALMGLAPSEGRIRVLGREPFRERAALMRDVAFVPDVAVLPGWMRVGRAIDLAAALYPRFRRDRVLAFLERCRIPASHRVRTLSKGLKAQLHLAIATAVDARLLVLDEPTLGLDFLARRAFYDALAAEQSQSSRAILITTHQVDEVEPLLSDLLFVDRGRLVLDCAVDALGARFAALEAAPEHLIEARGLKPFHERRLADRVELYFEGADPATLARFGAVRTPGVADLFIARLGGSAP
ncbi:MAG: ABC transporter ATP-binding protein [Gammaproteobacteria bacterium]|nr:ABC transporter ATP-binding protein [Gammaproteobacteria bacterium]